MFRPPEVAALISPIACQAYALRCEGRSDIKNRTTISTGASLNGTPISVELLNTTTSSDVCSAKLFPGIAFVECLTPVTPQYAARFLNSLLSLSISGEKVINQSAVNLHLLCPACLVAEQPTTQTKLILGQPAEEYLMGLCQMFFLPDDTDLVAVLENIPTGGGDLDVNFGVVLANYTTKVRQGCLFSVGALDAQQQAYPVNYPCNATFGTQGPAAGGAAAPTLSYGPATGLKG